MNPKKIPSSSNEDKEFTSITAASLVPDSGHSCQLCKQPQQRTIFVLGSRSLAWCLVLVTQLRQHVGANHENKTGLKIQTYIDTKMCREWLFPTLPHNMKVNICFQILFLYWNSKPCQFTALIGQNQFALQTSTDARNHGTGLQRLARNHGTGLHRLVTSTYVKPYNWDKHSAHATSLNVARSILLG